MAELQVALFDFRQQRFCALRKSRDGQAVFLVIVLPLNVGRGRAEEKCSPQGFGEMHPEAQSIGMRQGVDQVVDEGSAWPANFAVFAADGVDAPGMISEKRGNFVGK